MKFLEKKKHPITPLGWKIKVKLIEKQMDQKTFCDMNKIPASRLSNLIHGTRKTNRYREQVVALLGITDE
ncbi:XRE family transcriptional regulator [Paenibacillus peoriae]|uniref:XRE family transcriptional regulator n=1 Tax=Paenibacillus peoriae TaxID=59893 RepID=UPI001CC21047|nr:XRE family transcriptional regulator [Paenibacillus peoriae]